MKRLNHLVSSKTTSIYTDHANLIYIFDPFGSSPGLPRHTTSKLTRWAIKLSTYRFEIEHVAGVRNVWADLLTRWAVQPSSYVKYSSALRRIMMAPVNPSLQQEFDRPCLEDIINSQESSKHKPSNVLKSNNLWRTADGKVWIPEHDHTLKLIIIITAHTDRSGQRLTTTTLTIVGKYFHWSTIKTNISDFLKSFLHCNVTSFSSTVPCPLGHSVHATKSNELIHSDYCYMGRGEGSYTYTLIIKDDISDYVWFRPCESADSDTTAKMLIEWFAAFGVVNKWISEQVHISKLKSSAICARYNTSTITLFSPIVPGRMGL